MRSAIFENPVAWRGGGVGVVTCDLVVVFAVGVCTGARQGNFCPTFDMYEKEQNVLRPLNIQLQQIANRMWCTTLCNGLLKSVKGALKAHMESRGTTTLVLSLGTRWW